ncbi:phage/plasmid primase, P4 family [Cupriavidus basilensis]|uniref:phage/plasmid primase, P4 family n=1 Tax=Cupriavidus basilensis TaxID=68895 RepID=UPI0007513796|nr:phage/plasmid primase, P4 family [Cupriavidus basilensis]
MQNNKYTCLAVRGFSVFPVVVDGKKPATSNGFKDASRDEAQLAQWSETHAHCNVGIATGKPSGIWVLDIDIKNNNVGIKSLGKLQKAHGELPETLTVETPSGGFHFYFRYPDDIDIKSRVAMVDGIDVRAAKGYVVAPPSKIDGNQYVWLDADIPIADAPDWLVKLVASPSPSNRHVTRPGEKIEKGGRNDFLMRAAFKFVKQGNAAERLPDHLQHLNQNQCEPPLPQTEVDEIAANVTRLHIESDHEEVRFTDLGNARRLSGLLGDKLRYFSPEKQWFQLTTEKYWRRVDELIVARGARTMIEEMHAEVARLGDGPYKLAMKKHAIRSESAKAINDAITLFRSEPDILVEVSALDQGEWLFPVENGIVNLRDGSFLPADSSLMITQTAGARFDADATCPIWEAFIDQIMGGDKELVAYLRRAVGYSLTTTTREHAMFFVYGTGANGKSTFLNILRALFGELGAQALGDLLLERFKGEVRAARVAIWLVFAANVSSP